MIHNTARLLLVTALASASVACPGKDSTTASATKAVAAPQTPPSPNNAPGPSEQAPGGAEPGLGDGSEAQRALLARAKSAFLNGQNEQARTLFEELAQSEPMSGPKVSGAIALAQIHLEAGRPEQALGVYEGLHKLAGHVPEVLIVLARAYGALERFGQAEAAYRKILEAQPDYLFAQYELGTVLARLGKREEAAEALLAYEKRVYRTSELLEGAETPEGEKLRALEALGMVQDERALKAMVAALGDAHPAVRQEAALTLGELGHTEARGMLERMAAEDRDATVRMAAREAASQLVEGVGREANGPGGVGPAP